MIRRSLFAKLTVAALLMIFVLPVPAAVPFQDSFGPGGPIAGWVGYDDALCALTCEPNGTDSVPASSPSSDGYFGRIKFTNTGPSAGGSPLYLNGSTTDSDYTVKARVYFDDYFAPAAYTPQICFYANPPNLGEVHASYPDYVRLTIHNGTLPNPYTISWTLTSGSFGYDEWLDIEVQVRGTTAKVFVKGIEVGTADWSTEVPTLNSGKYGIAMSGPPSTTAAGFSMFYDGFSVEATPPLTSVSEWSLYE